MTFKRITFSNSNSFSLYGSSGMCNQAEKEESQLDSIHKNTMHSLLRGES